MRIWSTNKIPSAPVIKEVINEYKVKEASLDLTSFNQRVSDYIKSAKEYIKNLNGKTVFFGAAAKGSVFLNALELSVENMPDAYIIDDIYEFLNTNERSVIFLK